MVLFIAILLAVSLSLGVEVGEVKEHKGRVDLLKSGALRGTPANRIEPVLEVGDIVRTKKKSYAKVSFIDGSSVEMFELSRLKVISYEDVREVGVGRGIVKFEVKSAKGLRGFRVNTPHAIIGVKGTVFWVYVVPGMTRVVLKKGNVEITYKKVKPKNNRAKTKLPSAGKPKPFGDKPPSEKSPSVEVILQ